VIRVAYSKIIIALKSSECFNNGSSLRGLRRFHRHLIRRMRRFPNFRDSRTRPRKEPLWIDTRLIDTCIHYRQARMSRCMKSFCRLVRPKRFRPSKQAECLLATRILFISDARSYLGELTNSDCNLQLQLQLRTLAMAFERSTGGLRPAATSDFRKKTARPTECDWSFGCCGSVCARGRKNGLK